MNNTAHSNEPHAPRTYYGRFQVNWPHTFRAWKVTSDPVQWCAELVLFVEWAPEPMRFTTPTPDHLVDTAREARELVLKYAAAQGGYVAKI